VDTLGQARVSVHIAIYGLTSRRIEQALLDLAQAGVRVSIKSDHVQSAGKAQRALLSRLRAAGIETIGGLATLGDDRLRQLLPGKVGGLLRHRARGVDPRRLDTQTQRVSISQEETFERDVADVEQLRAELRRMSVALAEHLVRSGETARTVTTKVRYPDFSIRSRSTSLPVGTDDPDRIAELACVLLDRALADRPGALRLVGVGLSGLEEHRQLTLV